MDIITNTVTGVYTRTVYLVGLPSGNTVAVEAHATFGELAVFLASLLVAALLVALLVKQWRH